MKSLCSKGTDLGVGICLFWVGGSIEIHVRRAITVRKIFLMDVQFNFSKGIRYQLRNFSYSQKKGFHNQFILGDGGGGGGVAVCSQSMVMVI